MSSKAIKKNAKRFLRNNAGPRQLSAVLKMVPRSLVEHKRDENLRKQVRYCAEKSPYYKRKFAELGIDPGKVRTIEDLGELLTPNSAVVETPREFICRQPQIAFETTGTKGRNKRIFFTNAEVNRETSHITFVFSLYGFTPKDRFANFFNFNFWAPGLLHQKAVEKFEAFCLPAGKVDPEEIYDRLDFYGINVLMGYPSLLLRLTEIADARGRKPMKGIMCSGEPLPQRLRRYIEDVWGCNTYMGYGCTESCGGIGGECIHRDGYHVDELDRIVEIINPDKDGFGEIVLTTLNRECMPLLRYKVADIGRLETERCRCGLPAARIMEIAGRSDDKVTIGCVDMLPSQLFEEVLSKVPGVTEDFQIKAFWEGHYEVIELYVESAAADKDSVVSAVMDAVRRDAPDLWKNYSLKMLDFRVAVVPPRSLRGGDVKLNKFVDTRRQQERHL